MVVGRHSSQACNYGCGFVMCFLFFVCVVDSGSLPNRTTTIVLLACLIVPPIRSPDIIYHLTWEGGGRINSLGKH